MANVTELVIDRSRWIRGNADDAYLLRSDGHMCCLGFLAKACGLPDGTILNQEAPSSTDEIAAAMPGGLTVPDGSEGFANSPLAHNLILANDHDGLDAIEREARITAGMAALGITVRFVDTMEGV